MKSVKLALLFIFTATIGGTMFAGEKPEFLAEDTMLENAQNPLSMDDFTVMEVTDNTTDSKKTKNTVEDVKKMMTKAESKLRQVKSVVQSDELKGMVNQIQKIKNSLKKMIFKNGPGFQITNKTDNPIWVSLIMDNEIVTNQDEYGRDQIAPGEKLTMEVDTNKPMLIGVYLEDPQTALFSSKTNQLSPAPDYLFATTASAQGKTKYLTWNPEKHNVPAKYLYPQTGRLAGMAGVSSSSYSLSNNVKPFHITLKE